MKKMNKSLLYFFIIANIFSQISLSCNGKIEDDIEEPSVEEPSSNLSLIIKAFNNKNNQPVGATVIEVYKTKEDRELGGNILLSKKTLNDGSVNFEEEEFSKHLSSENLDGIYYLKAYNKNLRQDTETPSLDFTKDKIVNQSIYLEDVTADKITVKVVVVMEDPIIPGTNIRFHEAFKTPGISSSWNDPHILNRDFKGIIEEASGNTINYEIVQIIDADTLFTYFKDDPEQRHFSIKEAVNYLNEPEWTTLKKRVTFFGGYDYNSMVKYYGFDKMRDNNEIQEVWIWSYPYSGLYESHMMGKNAFWLNSPPNSNPSCIELLTIMGWNYERDIACALESYGHRFESTMHKVYGWWDYENKTQLSQLTTWEKFSAYAGVYDKFEKGESHVGQVHFPPNGAYDYDWANVNQVRSYCDEWLNYPNIRGIENRSVDLSEWGSPRKSYHLGWMIYYHSHIPHFKGINPNDGKLNNWWHYVVNYNEAIKKE